ncbi:hypothetical protein B0H10DRAFT_2093639, partial [Mycena sp. CBHHK59/15]
MYIATDGECRLATKEHRLGFWVRRQVIGWRAAPAVGSRIPATGTPWGTPCRAVSGRLAIPRTKPVILHLLLFSHSRSAACHLPPGPPSRSCSRLPAASPSVPFAGGGALRVTGVCVTPVSGSERGGKYRSGRH